MRAVVNARIRRIRLYPVRGRIEDDGLANRHACVLVDPFFSSASSERWSLSQGVTE